MPLVFAVLLLVFAARSAAQQPPAAPATPSPPPKFEDRVEVVGVTPIHGVGLPKYKVPANIQVFKAGRVGSAHALDVPSLLLDRAASVTVNDSQGGSYQPDVVFRGFVGSPLLGASEGLAVYQDGVRINEPFGDTINWDALPDAAIASLNLIPGSNPLFGLNALGGALSLRTKDGFGYPGRRASVSTGSFGRHELTAEVGGHARSIGYFVAGSLTDEAGWRDHSPSTVRRLFGSISWRSTPSNLNLNVTTASNDLTGNGAAPVQLLDDDRDAVFTHPDRTDNDLALVTFNGQHRLSSRTAVDGVVYYRRSTVRTFNGDSADDEDEDDGSEDQGFDAVNNISRARGHARGLTAQLTRTAPFWGKDNHLILGAGADIASNGFEFGAEFASLTPDRGTIGSGLFEEDAFVDLRSRTMTASAFVTNTWSITRALSVTGSARVNWTSVELRDQIGTALTGDHRFRRVNPAAGLTYQLTSDVNLYGSYSQSSRVPTPVELTCADPEDPCRLPNAFVSDPPLEQIVADTWEGGARGTAGRASWTVSAFTTASTDDIIFVSSGTLRGEGHFENVARTRRRGIEASVQYEIADRLSAFGAYTLQRATFGTDLRIASQFHPQADGLEIAVDAGNDLPGVPAQNAKFGLAGTVTTRLSLGATIRVQSGQYVRGDEANLLPKVPGFAVADARARLRLTDHLALTVRVQNAFNAEYHTFGVLGDAGLLGASFEDEPRFYSPGAPRAAWIGLDARF